MPRYNKLPANVMQDLGLGAGVLATAFNAETGVLLEADIISATTDAGINAMYTPTLKDLGLTIGNMPENTMEMQVIDTIICSMTASLIALTPLAIQLGLGAADVGAKVGVSTPITPRATLLQTDFKDIWFVEDKADGGGMAILLKNALSTGGVNYQSTKKENGVWAFAATGFFSTADTTIVPMEFYIVDPPT